MSVKGYHDSVTFVHKGVEYTFKTEPNPLNNKQMWWFEPQHTMYAGSVREAKNHCQKLEET